MSSGPDAEARTSTVRATGRRQEIADAIATLSQLASEVAVDAILVGRAGLELDRVAVILRAIRDQEHLAAHVGVEQTEAGPRPDIVGADAELTHLMRTMAEVALEEPDRRATSRETRQDQARQPSPVAATAAGVNTLATSAPDVHADFVRRFRDLLKASLEQRAYRVSRDVTRNLVLLARDLGAVRADPRDCVRIQAEVVESFANDQPAELVEVAQEEATVLLIELLGYLARTYRDSNVDAGS